ncbi:NAD(P)-dependent oxidoreductase [Streptomyces albus]|uniref:NAD-dependent epimerase/dehydratase family protein n=1 Tax=Streptomyces albus TaxID=1888 RepID=UPI0033F57519
MRGNTGAGAGPHEYGSAGPGANADADGADADGAEADGGDGVAAGTVVLTGATGFIGSHVAEALRARAGAAAGADRLRLRVVGRTLPEPGAGPAIEWVRADLADPDSLRGVCRGARVLVHLASRVGGDAESCEAVNVRGTAALMAEARRAGVRRIVHLSTAAVYGRGPHRGADVGELVPRPASPASATRLAGERYALEAGGLVLRPGLVLGPGDRWVVPAYAELLARVPARWGEADTRLSMVAVDDLARLIVTAALTPRAVPTGIQHAGHPEPVRLSGLLAALVRHGVLPSLPGAEQGRPGAGPAGEGKRGQDRDQDWEWCLRRLEEVPGRVSARQFTLLARDHWYRSDRVWRLAGCAPGAPVIERVGDWADWYRRHLAR